MPVVLFASAPALAETWAPGWEEAPSGARGVGGEAALLVGFAPGFVPPFRAAERDRTAAGVAVSGWLGDRVRLSGEWEWLTDRTPAGETISGPGDVRLGTAVRVVSFGPVRLGLGWEAKLPNATNENELGTDETDITFGAWARLDRGPFRAGLAAGLGVLGNPLRYANQDDVPLLAADVGGAVAAWRVGGLVRAELPTARNPARVEAGARVRWGRRWFVEAEGAAGLTPAAADGRAVVRLGVAGSLPDPPVGE